MTKTRILTSQTKDAYEWMHKLLHGIPHEQWDVIPEGIETSLNWQVGHMILSHYFHAIWVIKGHQPDIIKAMPFNEYAALFTKGTAAATVGKVTGSDLTEHLKLVQQRSLDIMETLTDADMDSMLEPTPIPHPIARTKYESLDWNIKHTMYHCGQTAMVRRAVQGRYDFGLKV